MKKIITVTTYGPTKKPMIRLRGSWIGDALGFGVGERLTVNLSGDDAVTLRRLTEAEDCALDADIAERRAEKLLQRARALRASSSAACTVTR
jgi:hypothetical protein